MKAVYLVSILLVISHQSVAREVNKDVEMQEQIKLEDIEQDNLTNEKIKELLETQQTQNIKTSNAEEDNEKETTHKDQTRESVQYAEPPSASGINYDGYLSLRYLTPGPAINYVQPKDFVQQQQQQQHQQQLHHPEIQYVPQVHENDITYTVPSRQSLVKPFIGGGAPIHPMLTPQPQYVYVQAQPSGPLGTVQQLHQQQQQQQQQHQLPIEKTVYQQDQEQKNRGNYLQFISPAPGYLMVPYPYQLPHPQHIPHQQHFPQHLPPPILPSVAPSSVLAFSQGETGSSGSLQSSTSRPFISYGPHIPSTVAPLNEYGPSPLKSVLPLRYHTPKYTTSIEPQLILGPISLPPTIEYSHPTNHQPSYGYRYTQQSPSPFSFEGISNFLKRPYDHLMQAASVIMPRHKPSPSFPSFASYNPSYTGPLQNYNTIAYSVPYSPTKIYLKRDVKKSDKGKK